MFQWVVNVVANKFKINLMLIEIAQAGIISDAPTIYEIIVRFIQKILGFVAVLSILMIIISAVIMLTCFENDHQEELAKRYLAGSVIGLVVCLLSLVVVEAVMGIFR